MKINNIRIPTIWVVSICIVSLLIGLAIGESVIGSNQIVVNVQQRQITGVTFYINGTTTTPRSITEGDVLNFTAIISPTISGRTINFFSNNTLISGTYLTSVNGFAQGPVITITPPNTNSYIFNATG